MCARATSSYVYHVEVFATHTKTRHSRGHWRAHAPLLHGLTLRSLYVCAYRRSTSFRDSSVDDDRLAALARAQFDPGARESALAPTPFDIRELIINVET